MPIQVLEPRYIDAKKLLALLNSLFRRDDFKVTVCPERNPCPTSALI